MTTLTGAGVCGGIAFGKIQFFGEIMSKQAGER